MGMQGCKRVLQLMDSCWRRIQNHFPAQGCPKEKPEGALHGGGRTSMSDGLHDLLTQTSLINVLGPLNEMAGRQLQKLARPQQTRRASTKAKSWDSNVRGLGLPCRSKRNAHGTSETPDFPSPLTFLSGKWLRAPRSGTLALVRKLSGKAVQSHQRSQCQSVHLSLAQYAILRESL